MPFKLFIARPLSSLPLRIRVHEQCIPGTYSDVASGGSACLPCPANTYSTSMGSTSCTPCSCSTSSCVANSGSCVRAAFSIATGTDQVGQISWAKSVHDYLLSVGAKYVQVCLLSLQLQGGHHVPFKLHHYGTGSQAQARAGTHTSSSSLLRFALLALHSE